MANTIHLQAYKPLTITPPASADATAFNTLAQKHYKAQKNINTLQKSCLESIASLRELEEKTADLDLKDKIKDQLIEESKNLEVFDSIKEKLNYFKSEIEKINPRKR